MLVPLRPPGEQRHRGPEEGQGGPPHQGGGGGASSGRPERAAGACIANASLLRLLLQVFLKMEEGDVEKALKDRTLLGSVLEAGLPS